MSSIHEKPAASLAASLVAAVNDVSYGQHVQLKEYKRLILPLDGYVFWVATGKEILVTGALYFLTENIQKEAKSLEQRNVIFSSKEEVKPFNQLSSDQIWVGNLDETRFVFGSRSSQITQDGLFHYIGESISPIFSTQFIDDLNIINDDEVIVSNSLPIFMALPTQSNPYLDWCRWPENVPIFPSYIVPDSQAPPYITVDIDPSFQQSLTPGLISTSDKSSFQFVTETVCLTLYGLTNNQAVNVRDYIVRWAATNPDRLGITNCPIIRDIRKYQPEINTLAMIKTISFEVMYCQHAARECGAQLIHKAKLPFRINK
ncbi:hypothetical protein [Aristophania vespae]|uniref:hypothetical protein n=1 Tax=Aristophania vespae TaxID=2697033 RepID=UPI002351A9D6|nr:hypothetical protein [Aristophania vespae]UMM63162.1 hypothetical protein DM15PD_01170 [Aristophania vespae]